MDKSRYFNYSLQKCGAGPKCPAILKGWGPEEQGGWSEQEVRQAHPEAVQPVPWDWTRAGPSGPQMNREQGGKGHLDSMTQGPVPQET